MADEGDGVLPEGREESTERETSSSDMSESEESEEEELFEVEDIVSMNKSKGKMLYKVRWKGYGKESDTWEPKENLWMCLDMVEAYENMVAEKKKKRMEERRRRKAIMEGKPLPGDRAKDKEDDSSSSSSDVGTLRDPFWKHLEEGRLDVFNVDLYSRVKEMSRAARPASFKTMYKNRRDESAENRTEQSHAEKDREVAPVPLDDGAVRGRGRARGRGTGRGRGGNRGSRQAPSSHHQNTPSSRRTSSAPKRKRGRPLKVSSEEVPRFKKKRVVSSAFLSSTTDSSSDDDLPLAIKIGRRAKAGTSKDDAASPRKVVSAGEEEETKGEEPVAPASPSFPKKPKGLNVSTSCAASMSCLSSPLSSLSGDDRDSSPDVTLSDMIRRSSPSRLQATDKNQNLVVNQQVQAEPKPTEQQRAEEVICPERPPAAQEPQPMLVPQYEDISEDETPPPASKDAPPPPPYTTAPEMSVCVDVPFDQAKPLPMEVKEAVGDSGPHSAPPPPQHQNQSESGANKPAKKHRRLSGESKTEKKPKSEHSHSSGTSHSHGSGHSSGSKHKSRSARDSASTREPVASREPGGSVGGAKSDGKGGAKMSGKENTTSVMAGFSGSGSSRNLSSKTEAPKDGGQGGGSGGSSRRKDSVESGFPYSLPLEEILSSSMLPNLPENSKLKDKDLDLAFEISLDDIRPEDLEAYEYSPIYAPTELTNAELKQAVLDGDYDLLKAAFATMKPYDVEQPDDSGTTLLMQAVSKGYDDIAELLICNGANVNAQHKSGSTAIMLACEQQSCHICSVSLLVEMGANINMQQNTGETALMKAVKRGNKQIVKYLLENGANFAMQSHSGNSAVTLAKLCNARPIETVITDHITKLTNEFYRQVTLTVNNTARILSALFPLQCFPLCERDSFQISFKHSAEPLTPGVGFLLFIAHARITSEEVKCRLYGPCAVRSVLLNGFAQPPLTEANFVLSCQPLLAGKNELQILTEHAPTSKAKLVVCAYKAEVIEPVT